MKNQPVLSLSYTDLEKKIFAVALFFNVIALGLAALKFASLPELVPTHFDASGNANRFGSKSTIFVLPAIATLMTVVFWFVMRIPHRFNFLVKITPENAERQYRIARLMLISLAAAESLSFALLNWQVVQVASGAATRMSGAYFLPLVLMPMIIVIAFAFYSGKK